MGEIAKTKVPPEPRVVAIYFGRGNFPDPDDFSTDKEWLFSDGFVWLDLYAFQEMGTPIDAGDENMVLFGYYDTKNKTLHQVSKQPVPTDMAYKDDIIENVIRAYRAQDDGNFYINTNERDMTPYKVHYRIESDEVELCSIEKISGFYTRHDENIQDEISKENLHTLTRYIRSLEGLGNDPIEKE